MGEGGNGKGDGQWGGESEWVKSLLWTEQELYNFQGGRVKSEGLAKMGSLSFNASCNVLVKRINTFSVRDNLSKLTLQQELIYRAVCANIIQVPIYLLCIRSTTSADGVTVQVDGL